MSGGPAARFRVRWFHAAPLALLLVLLGAWAARRAHVARRSPPEATTAEGAAGGRPLTPEPSGPPTAEGDDASFPRQAVTLYWPRSDGAGLVPREAEIFATVRATDRAKQVVELVLRGPEPPSGLVNGVPAGTELRALYLDQRGVAYVSLSEQLVKGAAGGSARELSLVYSIVNSLVRSLPEVERVQLLVEGRDVETIGGHLDARRPFAFSERVLASPAKG